MVIEVRERVGSEMKEREREDNEVGEWKVEKGESAWGE